MDYGRLGKAEPGGASTRIQSTDLTFKPKVSKFRLLVIIAATLLVVSAISAAVAVVIRNKTNSPMQNRRPSQAMSRACSRTLYPALCLNSLLEVPGAVTASDKELVDISLNLTLQRVSRSLYVASEITNLDMDPHVRSAYVDCLELLDHSMDLLSRSLTSAAEPAGSTQDVLTWLSAALTNQDTCSEGFDDMNGEVKSLMSDRIKDLSELVSNSLAIYASAGDDISGIPIQNRRRRLLSHDERFPAWLRRRERMMLDMPTAAINADVVVSKDGLNGTVKTIAEAIKKAPDYGSRRFIIYVKAGRYEENNLKVGRKKTNVMFIGDGKGKTVITGGKSIQDKLTTFHTASFAATGSGFIARDITFENYAGAGKHQAVALRVGADHAVVYRCNIVGYQDTLYTHSQRQFYRDCDIYGTVDFIFGNAAVVFQNCVIHARKPMQQQKITITAQNRKDPNQNTGMSIHNCRVVAEPDLEASKAQFPTYLGRPWKLYSRTVYMLSYLGDHIDPNGWLEWSGDFALHTLYYGEYMNYGPGAGLGRRVKWPGYRVINSTEEAAKFTVAKFIYGSSWLPATGVAFMAGLSA